MQKAFLVSFLSFDCSCKLLSMGLTFLTCRGVWLKLPVVSVSFLPT